MEEEMSRIKDELLLEIERQQAKLDKVRNEYEAFVQTFKEERDRVNQANVADDQIFKLNVSGITNGFQVSKKLLCSAKDSVLEAMFSGRHPIKTNEAGEVMLDSDPELFRMVLNCLKETKTPIKVEKELLKSKLMQEFNYWCIEVKNEIKVENETIDMLQNQLTILNEVTHGCKPCNLQKRLREIQFKFNLPPINARQELKEKFKEVGPINVIEVYNKFS